MAGAMLAQLLRRRQEATESPYQRFREPLAVSIEHGRENVKSDLIVRAILC